MVAPMPGEGLTLPLSCNRTMTKVKTMKKLENYKDKHNDKHNDNYKDKGKGKNKGCDGEREIDSADLLLFCNKTMTKSL